MNARLQKWMRTVLVGLVVAILGGAHYSILLRAKAAMSVTPEEGVNLVAGITAWDERDYRLAPEGGVLPQRFGSAPLLKDPIVTAEKKNNQAWRYSDGSRYAYATLFEIAGQDHVPVLHLARQRMAWLSVALCVLIFAWARHLFGDIAGISSAAIYAFSPEFLAHGGLVTDDVSSILFSLAALGALWAHLNNPRSLWWTVASPASLALALASGHYGFPLLLAMAALLSIHVWAKWGNGERKSLVLCAVRLVVIHAAIALAGIWALYGFRYAAFSPNTPPAERFYVPWETVTEPLPAWQQRAIDAARKFKALPEGFLYGHAAAVFNKASPRPVYLNGVISDEGFLSYLPKAFAYKTTFGVILGLGLLAWIWGSRLWRRKTDLKTLRTVAYSSAPLLVAVAAIGYAVMFRGAGTEHRNILAIYPLLYIALGFLAVAWRDAVRPMRAAIVAALVLHVFASFATHPHYLAFFNVAAGGADEGHRRLVDSSADWGQSLPSLKEWIAINREPGERVFLSYHGFAPPRAYGIEAVETGPPTDLFREHDPEWRHYEPGLFAISATKLSLLYSDNRKPWTRDMEERYRMLRESEIRARPTLHAAFRSSQRRNVVKMLSDYDSVRANRLARFLKGREPIGVVGGSILVFRLSASDLAEFDGEPRDEWYLNPSILPDRGR